MTTSQQIANKLLEKKAVTLSVDPPYTWTSGIKAPIYCDNRVLISYPDAYHKVIDGFKKIIEENNLEFDMISGTATAGIPWAAFLAYELNKPMVYVRHKAKNYGASKQIEGYASENKKILIVEDLISTGGSVHRSIDICRDEAKAEVVASLAIFTYEFPESTQGFEERGVRSFTLSNFSTLVKEAAEQEYIKPEDKDLIMQWSANPKQWP